MPATSIATSTSRTDCGTVAAGTVTSTAKTAVTTHVRTAAPVRSTVSSVTTTAVPSSSERKPYTKVRPPVRATGRVVKAGPTATPPISPAYGGGSGAAANPSATSPPS